LGLNKNADISEDCLLLNVYTTSLKEKRPVLVVLHGGSDKEMGSSVLSIHNPEVFVAMTGIVVVTVNYRVGIFGNLFFNNGTEFFPGEIYII
jgi:carboxylesterase type B